MKYLQYSIFITLKFFLCMEDVENHLNIYTFIYIKGFREIYKKKYEENE